MSDKLVMHNQISLDGAITGFEAKLELHYRLVAGYAPGLMLVGSVTAKTGIETFSGPVPQEEDADRRRPENPDDATPYWVIVGAGSPNLFRTIHEAVDVQLVRTESVEGYARLVYRVTRPSNMARR